MSTRTTGIVAVVIGVLAVGASLASSEPLSIKAVLGGVAFIGFGLYYLISGKKAASIKEFVIEGKLNVDKKNDRIT
jgi:EamA domain-containing membrane protein RarD